MINHPNHCRNCNVPLSGEYCSQCGQREGRGDLQFSDLAGEVVEEFVSWDSRIWRTLVPLVFRPGFLTAEFIAGRRARYVPPFRLYLFVSFFLFLVVSFTADTVGFIQVENADDRPSQPALDVPAPEAGSTNTYTRGDAEHLAAPKTESGPQVAIELAPRRSTVAGAEDEIVFAPIVLGGSGGETAGSPDFGISLSDEDSPKWLRDLDSRLEDNADKVAGDPAALLQQLLDYMPQMMFLLLPVFALLLKVNYLFSPFHYLQHLVFALHLHSFFYLLYLAGILVKSWDTEVSLLVPSLLVLLLYLTMALRCAYGSGLFAATGKALFILLIDVILLVVGISFVSLLALALL